MYRAKAIADDADQSISRDCPISSIAPIIIGHQPTRQVVHRGRRSWLHHHPALVSDAADIGGLMREYAQVTSYG